MTVYAETSTVSGSGDQGADPNELVKITDDLGATSLPAHEHFDTVVRARNGVVVRGVSFTPGTGELPRPRARPALARTGTDFTRASSFRPWVVVAVSPAGSTPAGLTVLVLGRGRRLRHPPADRRRWRRA